MRSKILNELKISFMPYAQLWEEWIENKCCKLNPEEISFINFHIANDFNVSVSDFITFYSKIKIMKSVIEKLNSQHNEFQDWVIQRLPQFIGKVGQDSNLRFFLHTPISDLSINDALKQILKTFGTITISEILDKHTDQDFKTESTFKNIVSLQYTLGKNKKLNSGELSF
jgi:hypothetical protein